MVKKQLDNYSRQIDGFEKKIKSALENKHSWRRKYMAKEGEFEALKVHRLGMCVDKRDADQKLFRPQTQSSIRSSR